MNPTKAVSIIEDFNSGDYTDEQLLEAWQYLVDTGIVWQLQGYYGRTAMQLIEQGLITLGGAR